MSKKSHPVRDAFTFGLLGLATKASFVALPVIADDRLEQAREQRKREQETAGQQSSDEQSTDEQSNDQDRAA